MIRDDYNDNNYENNDIYNSVYYLQRPQARGWWVEYASYTRRACLMYASLYLYSMDCLRKRWVCYIFKVIYAYNFD